MSVDFHYEEEEKEEEDDPSNEGKKIGFAPH